MNRRILFAGVLLTVAIAGLLAFMRHALNQPMNLPRTGSYTLEVPAGASLVTVANRLEAEGILAYPALLVMYGRISGDAGRIKAGEYEIPVDSTPLLFLQQLVEGRVKLHSLTIVEGWTLYDVVRTIKKSKTLDRTLTADRDINLAADLELPSAQAEGWFFPDTYKFPRNTTDRELLTIAYTRMRVVLDRVWAGRDKDLPLESPYEALILASIIEKETSLDREKSKVAGVFIRRLQAGMKLQTDPTVIYGLGDEFGGDLTRRQLLKDTPYNTYVHAGLPPTPICMPAESSLLAAVHPDHSKNLYFVATGEDDGSHAFSATLREHNAAVKKYLETTRERAKE